MFIILFEHMPKKVITLAADTSAGPSVYPTLQEAKDRVSSYVVANSTKTGKFTLLDYVAGKVVSTVTIGKIELPWVDV